MKRENIWLTDPGPEKMFFRIGDLETILGLKPSLVKKYQRLIPRLRPTKQPGEKQGWYSREKLELWAIVKDMRVNRKMNLQAIQVAVRGRWYEDAPQTKIAEKPESPKREYAY